jgi:hypothetical protein
MTEQSAHQADVRCARCGEPASGRFCSNCGAPVREISCEACGQSLQAGARFCNNCGAPAGATAGGGAGKRREVDVGLARLVGGAAILALIAFVAGARLGRQSSAPDAGPAEQPGVTLGSATAPDISNMSPEERASRLFNRVMAYSEQGKMDSARFFAPMAIQAYQMIGPLDLHARYDIGTIAAAVGETAMARLEADSILAAQPTNLLGLVLAIRAAGSAGDTKAVARFQQRLVAAAPSERNKGTKEYGEHGRDIDEALKKAGASPAPSPSP